MNPHALVVYCICLLVLWLKFFVLITIQARERHRSCFYRYPEDASHWSGSLGSDSDLCSRAQNILRNDSESQPHFLVLGLLYLLVHAWPLGALFYFPLYTLTRLLHSYFLLNPYQPHRTSAFGAGVLILTIVAVHVLVAAVDVALNQ